MIRSKDFFPLFALLLAAVPLSSFAQSGEPKMAEALPVEERFDVEPILDTPLRDPSICLGPDGTFYLTGTLSFKDEGEDFQNNPGIRLWQSKDLKNWEDMGLVFDGPGRDRAHRWMTRPMGDADVVDSLRHNSGLIAPEIHYLKGTFWLTFSRNEIGTGLLRSATGKPEGDTWTVP